MTDLHSIHYIIWDLDGTLYPFSEEMDARCIVAAAKAAIEHGFPGGQQVAEALALEGFCVANNGLEIFCDHYGVPLAELHGSYHRHIDIAHLAPYRDLAVLLQSSGLLHATLTHGSTEWAHRILKQRHLDECFKPELVIGMEQYQFQKKHKDYLPFELCMQRLGNPPPHQVLMVEDAIRNLSIPHEMGMQTALIDYHSQHHDVPETVQYQFQTPIALMEALLKAHSKA